LNHGKVIRSARIVGGFTLLSRALGMLRDILIAFHFGTSLLASAFFVAFTLPNLFRRLFGEGALSSAFIPVFIETREKEGEKAAWEMAGKIISISMTLLFTLAVLGVLLFSLGTRIPGLSEKWITTFELSQIMFPYVLFICLAALAMAILNSFMHFAVPAFAPCLLNLILIFTMAVLFPFFGNTADRKVWMLSWAVLAAGVAQLAIQLPALRQFGFRFQFSLNWKNPHVKQVLLLMGPAALGLAVTQINVLIDRLLAMWIGPWAPAALFYSERLIYLPLGVFATALGTVLLPTFSTQAAGNNHTAMRATVNQSVRQLMYIMIPASAGLLVLAPHIIRTIFEWGGSFSENSTGLSAIALRCYAPGLIVFSLAKIFVPAFYSMQDMRTPVRIGIGVVLFNLTLNILFILTFPLYYKHAGMALATVIAEGAGIAALGLTLTRRIGGFQWPEILKSFSRCLLCALLMGAVVWELINRLFPMFGNPVSSMPKLVQVIAVGIAVAAGALLYVVLTVLLRAPEFQEIKQTVRKQS